MAEMEKITITVDGEEKECDVLFTFDCEATGKSYIGYTDHSISENGRKNIYVKSFDPVLGTAVLEDIATEEEQEMIQDVLVQIDKEVRR